MEEHCKGLNTILDSGLDGDVVVEPGLLKDVDERVKSVRQKSADRFLRLAYENAKSAILTSIEASQRQINCQPVKYASQAHVEKALRDHVVCSGNRYAIQ